MRNDILDEAEEHTGPRTCPECGYQVPFAEFVRRTVMSYGLSKWHCQACRELIKCDLVKVQFLWLLGLVPFGFLFSILSTYADIGGGNIIYSIPFFAFVLLTFYYVKFEKEE